MNAPGFLAPGSSRPDKFERGRRAAGWILPGAVLLLMPKCPACLAAWIAIGTGVGVSLSTAATLRTGLLMLSGGLLALIAVKTTCRLFRHLHGAAKTGKP